MHTYNDILDNTLEQMLTEAEYHGRDGIQPMLTPDDVRIIIKALRWCRQPCETEGMALGDTEHNSPFKVTVEGMLSTDYKERFKAEYQQTKIRYEKLKAFNNKIDAAQRTHGDPFAPKKVEEPTHDCPAALLREQQSAMGQYLHILEVRAVIEGIEL